MSELRSLLQEHLSPHDLIVSISKLIRSPGGVHRFGSFSPSVYDTAWLSMVRGSVDPHATWLFSEAFEYILRTQDQDGTWQTYATPVDGILNTIASLLALLVCRVAHQDVRETRFPHADRIEKACRGLQSLLDKWRVEDTVHVGFEVLVPGLLSQIRQYGTEFDFDFPDRPLLNALREEKMRLFNPELVYSPQSATLLHSLEGLVGMIDFDRVRHHCRKDSGIFGSPAATAAYLIHSSYWDDDAEAYLRTVIEQGVDGGVPSAFPTVLFESSWALSSLLNTVVDRQELDRTTVDTLTSFFNDVIHDQAGLAGFAPGVLEDADDTARVLLTLSYLGAEIDLDPMIETFQSALCFRTYRLEGKPSMSANCNVLLALLNSPTIERYKQAIQGTLKYLLSRWTSGEVADKWNLSPHYSNMLLVDVLVKTLEKVDAGHLCGLGECLVRHEIPSVICQVLMRMFSSQKSNGSWNNSVEETSYAVMTIVMCLTLPWEHVVSGDLQTAYEAAHTFLTQSSQEGGNQVHVDYLWIEKVSYSSALLSQVYRLAAVHSAIKHRTWSAEMTKGFVTLQQYANKIRPMLPCLPLFARHNFDHVSLAFFEATQLGQRLQKVRNEIFPRDQLPVTKDKYLAFIPMIWTVCNQRRGCVLTPGVVWEMCVLSMLNYQIDEYMETAVRDLSTISLSLLLSSIRRHCSLPDAHTHVRHPFLVTQGTDHGASDPSASQNTSHHEAAGILCAYVDHVLQHETITRLSAPNRHSLARCLYDFVLSHVAQNLNSQAHFDHPPGSRQDAKAALPFGQQDFFTWIRTSAADSTSCPMSFRFFVALLGRQGEVLDQGARPRYLSQALARHLAVLCRMYNDCGSAVRDAEEGTLNSLDFAEFRAIDGHRYDRTSVAEPATAEDVSEPMRRRSMQSDLLELSQFERGCTERAYDALGEVVRSPTTMAAVRVFIDVTDMFGQIYVQQDIASRVSRRSE